MRGILQLLGDLSSGGPFFFPKPSNVPLQLQNFRTADPEPELITALILASAALEPLTQNLSSSSQNLRNFLWRWHRQGVLLADRTSFCLVLGLGFRV